ncbi:hypothetical protein FT643_23015 [Ketobacter sp. MCCC 1A13808]|uniref:hypothetical protein n=1 Tax=Ketobacter sp. MCCC 1A13808 TaxID=2602738 RepID=UPI0012EC4CF6|nr:hypothetical protein [Ketobacter sp. MCCC 1A13808]MVF14998.1 hypothetical protein [Ketobacter sp. MCCC 1A13808]
MKFILFLSLFVTSFICYADGVKEIHIERRDIGEILGKSVLPVNIDGKGYVSKEVWRSPKGIYCSVSLFEQNKKPDVGTFECKSTEGFKAQVSIDCAINKNSEMAVYLFFGRVNYEGENSNFYVWCE